MRAAASALTDEFRATYDGARQLERINTLVRAVVVESRGLVDGVEYGHAGKHAAARLIAFNDRLGDACHRTAVEYRAGGKGVLRCLRRSALKTFRNSRRDLVSRNPDDRTMLVGIERE